MEGIVAISWWDLSLFCTTLSIPLAINRYFQLGLGKEAGISIIRMVVQLVLIGFYLEYLFHLNNVIVNTAWVILMILIGSSAILSKSSLPKRPLFFPVCLGLTVGLGPLMILLCLVIIQPTPLYSAQFVIPIAGMLLGNSLSGNIVALQNFFTSLNERKSEYEAAISLGAHPYYASNGFIRSAMQKSLAPIMASMATTGLVTLPGMMTGQILGGASPMVAIKYQLMIMIAIFVMMSISITLTLQLCLRQTFTQQGRIKIQFIHQQDQN